MARKGYGGSAFDAVWAMPWLVGCASAQLVGCASATVPARLGPARADASCDQARSASFVAGGDLDGALDALAGCASEPATLLTRMRALVDLSEIARAKEIARSVDFEAPSAVRSAADQVLALADPSPSRAEALRYARSSAVEGSKLEPTDAVAAARAYGRARHLFERATGAKSAHAAIEAPSPIGWSGDLPLWSVALRVATSSAAPRRYLLVTELDDAGALVPIAALELGPADRVTPLPWPRPGGGAMVASIDANALWSAPWLAPVTLPAGRGTFDPSGSTLLVARRGNLEAFATSGGARLFAWPQVEATGNGVFVTPTRYAEAGASADGALVVDVANGAVLFHEAQTIASTVAPSGKLVAVLSVAEKPNAIPRLMLTLIDLGAPSKPRPIVDLGEAPLMSGSLSLAFDGDRGVAVLLSETSALMHEGSTDVRSYVALASKRAVAAPADYAAPDRFSTFARIAKLAAPSLEAPRVAIDFWVHSQTFDEDRPRARAALVTGIPTPSRFPSHVEQPSLVFVDVAAKKVLRDVLLPAAELTIEDVSLAPGGRSAIVCTMQGRSFLVDANTGEVLEGDFDCPERPQGFWAADGEHLITPSGVVTLHARGSRALFETPLVIAGTNGTAADAHAERLVAKHVKKSPPLGVACLIGTVLAPYDVCR